MKSILSKFSQFSFAEFGLIRKAQKYSVSFDVLDQIDGIPKIMKDNDLYPLNTPEEAK